MSDKAALTDEELAKLHATADSGTTIVNGLRLHATIDADRERIAELDVNNEKLVQAAATLATKLTMNTARLVAKLDTLRAEVDNLGLSLDIREQELQTAVGFLDDDPSPVVVKWLDSIGRGQ